MTEHGIRLPAKDKASRRRTHKFQLIQLTGEDSKRTISTRGVCYGGRLYYNKKTIERLLNRRVGRNKDWHIKIDPSDLGEILILDDEVGEWLPIPLWGTREISWNIIPPVPNPQSDGEITAIAESLGTASTLSRINSDCFISNTFTRFRTPEGERPLEEVYIEHCLIGLVVIHPVTKSPLGRPWLTALIDRATRVIVGTHLSLRAPSSISLRRAIAHGICQKDLSGVEGIEHSWPCHGIPERIVLFDDQGFRSKAFMNSLTMLGCAASFCPVQQHWLRDAVEALFTRIGVCVFSNAEDLKLSRTYGCSSSVDRSFYTLADVNQMLFKWIVDEYHETTHETLRCCPIEKWRELTDRHPVRAAPPNFFHSADLTWPRRRNSRKTR